MKAFAKTLSCSNKREELQTPRSNPDLYEYIAVTPLNYHSTAIKVKKSGMDQSRRLQWPMTSSYA